MYILVKRKAIIAYKNPNPAAIIFLILRSKTITNNGNQGYYAR
jgi:hypothetical protein